MRPHVRSALIALATVLAVGRGAEAADMPLFDRGGLPAAYIVSDAGLTVYLRNGVPAAYMEAGKGRDLNVYGFNGRHLGWYSFGVLRDHGGNVVCTVDRSNGKAAVTAFDAAQKYKPLRSVKQPPPRKPPFLSRWSGGSCGRLLSGGIL